MDGWSWLGDIETLRLGLEVPTRRRFEVTIERGIGGADDIYVVRPLGALP